MFIHPFKRLLLGLLGYSSTIFPSLSGTGGTGGTDGTSGTAGLAKSCLLGFPYWENSSQTTCTTHTKRLEGLFDHANLLRGRVRDSEGMET
jgi:hypothetical protein